VIVDDKDLHVRDRLQVAASSRVPECTSVPGRKHGADVWRTSAGQYFRMIHRDGGERAQSAAEEDDDGKTFEV
jgi:hypothetical protein